MLSRTQESAVRHSQIDVSHAESETAVAPALGNASAVSWSAVFAGAVAAAGLSLILLFIGSGIGLSVTSPWGRGASGGAIAVAAILWLGFTQIAASWIGGYLSGRLRTKWVRLHDHEVTFRDTAHGFLAWALATIITALLASSAIGAAVSGGAKVLGSAATTVASQASGPITTAASALFRSENQGAAPQASDPAMRDEASRIFTDAMQGNGGLAAADSRYLAQLVAQRTGLSPDQAQQRVNATFNEVKAKVQQAETTAKQAADKARKDSAYTALWFAIALLIGAFTASFSATYGGRTRDLV